MHGGRGLAVPACTSHAGFHGTRMGAGEWVERHWPAWPAVGWRAPSKVLGPLRAFLWERGSPPLSCGLLNSNFSFPLVLMSGSA